MTTADMAGGRWWRKLLQPYVWVCLALMLVFQVLAFYATRLLLPYLPVHTLSLPLDRMIPLVPEWVSIYCLAYVSWLVSGLIILSQGKEHAYRFTAAYAIAMLISAVIFLAWPLKLEWPEVTRNDFFCRLLRGIYSADQPNNLCPSLHVLASYFCWRGMWGCPRIPKWLKGFNLVFLVLVCLSILFVKQHLSIDIPVAFLVGEAALQAARRLNAAKYVH